MSLLWSLVLSRLLFNCHTIAPSARFIKILNNAYMKPVRRIAGAVRLGHASTELEARRAAQLPSIDCLLARARR